MVLLVQLVALFILVVGLLYFLKPHMMAGMIAFWEQGKRLYWAAAIRITFGLILLFGAGQCTSPRVLAAFGTLFLVSGLIIPVMGLEKTKAMMHRWIDGKSAGFLRLLALVALAIGVTIYFAI